MPLTRALSNSTRTLALEKSALSSPLESDHRPRGSSRLGNQPAAGQLTQAGLGAASLKGWPNR